MGTATPHDTLFHFTLQHARHAAGWLRTVMPAPLVAAIDWPTLRAAPEKIHGHTLRLLITDTVHEAELLPRRHRLFVVSEHKSHLSPAAHSQLVRYCVHLAHATATGRQPPALVIPILLCHGSAAWPDSQPHPHLEGLDHELAAMLASLQADMRILLDDLARCSEPELRRAGMTALAQLTLLCLRFLRAWTTTEVLAGIDRWRDLVAAVDRDKGPPAGPDAIEKIAWYCLHVTEVPAEDLHVAFERILQRPEDTIMSTAEKLKREGRIEGEARGEAKGRAELLLRQLTKRFGPLPPATVARIHTTAIADLDRWGERLLDAKTLADVFAAD